MEWVKKNPVIVAGSSVAVVLLGLAVWFLLSEVAASSEADEALGALKAGRDSLWQGKPFPSKDNIDAMSKDQERVSKFTASLQTVIPQMPPAYNLDDRRLKILVEQSITELALAATNSKTAIPPDYSFSFTAMRKKLTYKTNTHETIALQLSDVKMLLGLLFDSKINGLETIRRSRLTQDDDQGDDYLFLFPKTNQFSIIAPYELRFRCFGTELETVVQNLVNASNCIVIKNINISQARVAQVSPDVINLIQLAAASGQVSIGAAAVTATAKPPDPTGRDRYESIRRPPTTPGGLSASLVDTNKPITVLSEKPLRVSILLDVVRTLRPAK